MAGANITITVEDAEVAAALNDLSARVADLTPALQDIGASMVASTLHRFETESDPDGRRWIPSARVLELGGQTLTDQAHLRQSITYVVGGDSVAWGSNLVYAAIHQFGGRTGRGHAVDMPARAFLGVNEDDRHDILAILREHIDPDGLLQGTP